MRRRAKIDGTATALVQAVRAFGGQWLPLPGCAVDGLVLYRGQVLVIDFKSGPTARKTATQQRLVAEGWPIRFWATLRDVVEGLR